MRSAHRSEAHRQRHAALASATDGGRCRGAAESRFGSEANISSVRCAPCHFGVLVVVSSAAVLSPSRSLFFLPPRRYSSCGPRRRMAIVLPRLPLPLTPPRMIAPLLLPLLLLVMMIMMMRRMMRGRTGSRVGSCWLCCRPRRPRNGGSWSVAGWTFARHSTTKSAATSTRQWCRHCRTTLRRTQVRHREPPRLGLRCWCCLVVGGEGRRVGSSIGVRQPLCTALLLAAFMPPVR